MGLNPLCDSRDIRFVLFELLEIEQICDHEKYADFDRDTIEEVLELAEKIAVEQVYPGNSESDRTGVSYDPETKGVAVPPPLKEALKIYIEAGFAATVEDPEIGGMGLPAGVAMACHELFTSANLSMTMYPALAHGAARLIETFGTDELKEKYMLRMFAGEWGGTMCLTEPEAGSDVGALKTKAVRNEDGTYSISGQKIFISAGENDLYENIVHAVLARIEGDPAGSKGISIFIVPKYRLHPDGSMGEPNDVECSGIEHKMGIHASCTCTLNFGDKGNCVGYLLGEERKGMKIMFQLMNEARLLVGLQGLALSSTSYMHAVTYARTRQQGVHVTQLLNPEAPKVSIMEHPDIKRSLLYMKSYVEGMRMLVYFLAHQLGLVYLMDGEEKKQALGLAEILIPICKAGCTDTSLLIASEAVQVYGGYGYVSDYPVEQYLRDAKIGALYEGTNGIQAMDLTMRKILMNPEQYNYTVWKERVASTVSRAKGIVDDKYTGMVERGMAKTDEIIEKFKANMGAGKFLHIFSNATPLREAMFLVTLAWMHLWSLTLCLPKMRDLVGERKGEEREAFINENNEAAYYSGKVLSSQFFLGSEFPKFFGMAEALLLEETAVIKASDAVFTGAPLE